MNREAFERLFNMTGRAVIVTGGTRGIGLALAEGFVLAGARVAVASRKHDACEQAAEHLRGLGGQAIGVPTHLGDVDDLAALVQRTPSTSSAASTWWSTTPPTHSRSRSDR